MNRFVSGSLRLDHSFLFKLERLAKIAGSSTIKSDSELQACDVFAAHWINSEMAELLDDVNSEEARLDALFDALGILLAALATHSNDNLGFAFYEYLKAQSDRNRPSMHHHEAIGHFIEGLNKQIPLVRERTRNDGVLMFFNKLQWLLESTKRRGEG